MTAIHLTISYPPTSNHNTTVAEGRRISSAKYRSWRKLAEWEAKLSAAGRRIEGPYHITYVAQRPDRRRRDVENLPKSLSDAIQAAGVIRDDADCERSTVEWSAAGPTKDPKVFVLIEPISVGAVAA